MRPPALSNHAVVLSGGGAYGAYEVGVMKALFNGESPATELTPLNASIFTGTSVGSYNASMMVSQPGMHSAETVSYLERVWVNKIADNAEECGNGVYKFRVNLLSSLDPDCLRSHPLEPLAGLAEDAAFFAQDWFKRAYDFATSTATLGRRAVDLVDLSTLISTAPFARLLRETLDLAGIRASDKLLSLAATNFDTGKTQLFENAQMTDQLGYQVVMASSAVPGFFPPVEINGTIYLDGGVTMNTPLSPAVHAGADTLHVVYIDPDVKNIPVARLQSTLDVLDRVLVISFAAAIERDISLATSINEGLNLLERFSETEQQLTSAARNGGGGGRPSLAKEQARSFLQVASQLKERIAKGSPYRKITIHRYHPEEDLGGMLGLLNFERQKTIDLIERGYQDTVEHDCLKSGCTLPEGFKRPDLSSHRPVADRRR